MTKKISQQRTLFFLFDHNITKSMTNIKFTPKKFAGAVGFDRSPGPGFQACTGWTPAQPC